MSLDKAALESLRMNRGSDPERYEERGAGRRRWRIIAAVVAVVAALLAWRMVTSPIEVRTVTVESPAGASDGAVLNASGYVVARRLATVSSKVTGRIDEVLFEEGATVTDGQLLARLDPSNAEADLKVADSSLVAAQRNLREIEVRLADARRTQKRYQELVARKLVAQSLLDAADAEASALEARLAASQAEVGVAQSRVAQARQGLADLEIRAPFAGVVISKDAQPGETVSPMSAGGGYTRTGIATIVDMDSREIEVDVNEAYINRVHEGQKAAAVLDAYPDWTIPGHVIGIVPTADRQKATVKVRIGFDALDPRMLPDMGIKVRFLEGAGAPSAAVQPRLPAAAVVKDGDKTYVWVVRDARVERREVVLGAAQGDEFPVSSGLEGGESVVVDAPRRLRDGSAVELVAS